MKKIIILLLAIYTSPVLAQYVLVKNGEAKMGIVVPHATKKLQKLAIDDFVKTIQLSTGVTLPQVPENEFEVDKNTGLKMVFGPSELTKKILGQNPKLELEEFKIITKDNFVVILAKEVERNMEVRSSCTTVFALSHIMENYMGVKWLWPGELGTHIPALKQIELPQLNFTHQPKLLRRRFNLPQKEEELLLWANHHRASGERVTYNFMHSFRKIGANGDWWGDFKDTKPHMLAQDPLGKPQMGNKPDFYQICTTHPDSRAEVIKRWEAAGMPEYWDITANDGIGFCTCKLCMELDEKLGGHKHSKEQVFNYTVEEINLTERHVDFWNDIVTRMRARRADAKVLVFLYGRYRQPPVNMKLAPGIMGELVHGYDFNLWQKWTNAGISGIGLRPNWWHMGANAPHLPLHTVADYINQAHQNKMTHLFMDSMVEYWATQGPYYYLVAKMADNDQLNADLIIEDYASVFGEAKKEIKEYIKYWEDYHNEVDYNIPAGGILKVNEDGIYEKICKEKFKVSQHPLSGHWKTLPFVYTPEIIAKADKILNNAAKKVKKDEKNSNRIAFLRDGLRHLELTIKYMSAEKANKTAIATELSEFDKKMKEKHGYWNSKELQMLKTWGLLDKEFSVDEM